MNAADGQSNDNDLVRIICQHRQASISGGDLRPIASLRQDALARSPLLAEAAETTSGVTCLACSQAAFKAWLAFNAAAPVASELLAPHTFGLLIRVREPSAHIKRANTPILTLQSSSHI
jgi:hypothetical protein